jgi:hypothetical protein
LPTTENVIMPIHDWKNVDGGLFHHFHQAWTIEISNALNGSGLPEDFFAMVEVIGGRLPGTVTLQRSSSSSAPVWDGGGGIAVAEAPPKARFVKSIENAAYAGRANRIVIQHRLGKVVAVIEIVSPGNKSSQHALRAFAEKAAELLREGINLLVVDLFPPSRRDPQGIHQAILEQLDDEPFELPSDKPLTVAAYAGGEVITAYAEPVAVGDALPALPIFLDRRTYVPAPLESTYQSTWAKCPKPLRDVVENAHGPLTFGSM